MLTFILCVERYIHFPPEIYRLLATYLYYKQHWPDVNIKQYNKVMKQLPYPIHASAPRIIYQNLYQSTKKMWRCCKLRYDIMLPFRLVSRAGGGWGKALSIIEYPILFTQR